MSDDKKPHDRDETETEGVEGSSDAGGPFSPRDQSEEARRYFAERRRRFPGRGPGSWSTGR